MTTPTWPREPWHVHKGELANEGRTFVKTDHNNGYKRWVAETTYTVGRDGSRADEATARRIAAAVNAVKGIPTEALEAGVLARLGAWVERCIPQIDHPSDPDRAVLRTILAEIGR